MGLPETAGALRQSPVCCWKEGALRLRFVLGSSALSFGSIVSNNCREQGGKNTPKQPAEMFVRCF